MVKNLPAMQETWVRSLGWEDSPGGGDPPVFLPGKSPWTEKPSGLQSMSHIELDMTEQLSIVQHIYIYTHTYIHTRTQEVFSLAHGKLCILKTYLDLCHQVQSE